MSPDARPLSSSPLSAAQPQPPARKAKIIEAIQQQLPADYIAERIGEMVQARQPGPGGGLETDWRTVEAGIRLYMDYMTIFPESAGPGAAALQAAAHGTEGERDKEASRRAPAYRVKNVAPRSFTRLVPARPAAPPAPPQALEPLEEMRKHLVVETPLPVLQEAIRHNRPIIATAAVEVPATFVRPAAPPPAVMPERPATSRHLGWSALAAILVITGALAGAVQLFAGSRIKPGGTSRGGALQSAAEPRPVPAANPQPLDKQKGLFNPEEQVLWW
jgi:hypothetical protein